MLIKALEYETVNPGVDDLPNPTSSPIDEKSKQYAHKENVTGRTDNVDLEAGHGHGPQLTTVSTNNFFQLLRPPKSTPSNSSGASDVYKRQLLMLSI